MRAGVDAKAPRIIVWQERIAIDVPERGAQRTLVKRKLEDLHPGQVEPFSQRDDFRRDHAQVLRQDGQLAQFALDGLKDGGLGAGHPASPHGGGFAGGDLPVGDKAAKVVDAHNVDGM